MSDEKIIRPLDHRMRSVELLNWALGLRSQWREAPAITVHIDGRLRIDGNLNVITNPILEMGLIHCRALLEFLGLCERGGMLAQIKRRRATDLGIERFRDGAGNLKMVEPEIALSRYKGDRSEAEKALVTILLVTNRGLAHNTIDLLDDPDRDHLVEIASRGVPALMVCYFYKPLGLPEPRSWIATRPSEAPDPSPPPRASAASM